MRTTIALAALACLLPGCGSGSVPPRPSGAPKAGTPSEVVIKYCTS